MISNIEVLSSLEFNNGVAKIGDPRASPLVYSRDVYLDAKMDSNLFDFFRTNYKSVNKLGYRTIRDTSCFYFYRETDLIWVFEPKNSLKYFIKLLEVHGFILFLIYTLKVFWYAFLLLNIFGIYWFLMEML